MKANVVLAFEQASRGFSPDRVVADPDLNRDFQNRCEQLGVTGSEATRNRTLINLRKQGAMRGLRSTKTSFPDEDQYRFAAEMAVRFLERRDGASLDDIICDPALALEFDQLAGRIAPGFSSVEYRWAALNLRKSRQLKPELLSRVVPAVSVEKFDVSSLDLNSIPRQAGLYVFFSGDRVLYVGEAENLQNRLRKHLDHSDNKGLARWLWEQESAVLHLEIHVLSATITTRVRRALEIEMIRSRNPVFNIKR